jgi:DtxR family Mn-dependent transcriptional regulator
VNVETEVSGSIEMYLATIAVLQADEQPVPLSQLADQMSHSPVSVNEMCRKLVERGWAAYQPYKGVTLTSQGATLAEQVLCRRRLWVVFLVDRLGADPREAEAFACQLEHATPDNLARRLAAYLACPARSPQDQPIPCPYGGRAHLPALPLSALIPGQRGLVTRVAADEIVRDFLHSQGVSPGAELEVLAASSDGSLLLRTSERCLCLSKALATQVEAQPLTDAESPSQIEVKR